MVHMITMLISIEHSNSSTSALIGHLKIISEASSKKKHFSDKMTSQPMSSTMAPKVKCTLCHKPYSASYLKRHMKKDHEDQEDQPKDLEMGTQNVENVTMWVENEKSFQTREIESFLNNKSEGELINAVALAEVVYDAEKQLDKEDMDMEQCMEWFDEDHNEAFNFTSDFAEELVREERPNRVEQMKQHKKTVAEQQKKDDMLIKHSNKLLEASEKQKNHFRKTVNRLEQELQDVYNDWEASEITNREEMDKLRGELDNEKKKHSVKANHPNKIQEVREIEQKCKHCRFTYKDSKTLDNHVSAVHMKYNEQKCQHCRFTCKDSKILDNHVSAVHMKHNEQKCQQCRFTCKDSQTLDNHVSAVHMNQNCHLCEETFASKAALRKHVRNHLMNNLEYSCGVCTNKFKNIEDARAHATKPC